MTELSATEREIVRWLLDGMPVPAISQRMGRPVDEIEQGVRLAYAKLGVANRGELRAAERERVENEPTRTGLYDALERTKPLLLDALSSVGVIRIDYVIDFEPRFRIWFLLGTATDAERDALPAEMPLIDDVLAVLRTADLPAVDDDQIGTTIQSQETVDRDYLGSWF